MTAEVFKTIKYDYISKKSDSLVVILPPAHSKPIDFELLVNFVDANSNFDILNIVDGYFGIGSPNFKTDLTLFNREKFLETFCELLSKLNYKRVVLIAESVGCLHAIDIYSKLPDSIIKIVLSNPAFYKDTFFTKHLYLLLVNIYLLLPNTQLSKFIVYCLMKSNRPGLHDLAKYIYTVKNVTGKKSFILCLKEIVLFTKLNKKVIQKALTEKAVVFIGSRDPFFKNLCDIDLCTAHAKVTTVEANHTLLKNFPEELQRELVYILSS